MGRVQYLIIKGRYPLEKFIKSSKERFLKEKAELLGEKIVSYLKDVSIAEKYADTMDNIKKFSKDIDINWKKQNLVIGCHPISTSHFMWHALPGSDFLVKDYLEIIVCHLILNRTREFLGWRFKFSDLADTHFCMSDDTKIIIKNNIVKIEICRKSGFYTKSLDIDYLSLYNKKETMKKLYPGIVLYDRIKEY